jgi:hypothetical protein
MTDLPWSPAAGKTDIWVVERSDAVVICEDKMQFGVRTMWRLDGALVAIGGRSLTLKAKAMKPEPEPEIAAPTPPVRRPATAQMSLF